MRKILLSVLLVTLFVALQPTCPVASAGTAYVASADSSAVNGQKQTQKRKKKKQAVRQPSKPEPAKEAWQRPMTVVLVRSSVPGCEPLCPEWLAAEGEITAGTPAVFRKALKQVDKRWLPVVIRSTGGDVKAAMEIGRMVRKAGLPVGVGWTLYNGCSPGDSSCAPPKPGEPYRGMAMAGQSFCLSACPLILAAGTERYAGLGDIGLHVIRRQWVREKITYRETERKVNGKIKRVRDVISRKVVSSYFKDGIDKEYRAKLLAYLKDMGIDPAYLDEMAKASYNQINRPTGARLEELRLITSRNTVLDVVVPDVCKRPTPARNCRDRPGQKAAEDAPRLLDVPSGEEMFVARVRAKGKCEPLCPEWIAAQGIVTPETPLRFKEVFAQSGTDLLPILIDSRGGDLDAAMEVGRMIRLRKATTLAATTIVFGCSPRDADCNRNRPRTEPYSGYAFTPGDCARECWFMFAGGVVRLGNWAANSNLPAATPFVTRQAGKPPEKLIADFMRTMRLPEKSLTVDRAKLQADLSSYDDNRIVMFRLSNHPGATNVFAEPASCRIADPPPNCIRRDKIE